MSCLIAIDSRRSRQKFARDSSCIQNPETGSEPANLVKVSGGHTGGATPDPIPNSDVKTSRAHGTAGETLWESRSPPGLFEWGSPRAKSSGAFRISELGELATEAFGDDVFDAVVGAVQALALAADLSAIYLALAQLAEVILETREAVGTQRRRAIDVAQAARAGRLRAANDHAALDLLRPDRQPVEAAARTLPQLLPLGQLHNRPLHHRVVLYSCPGGPRGA